MISPAARARVNGSSKPVRKEIRVAIYCRQSVADDLEFGSIQAQRETVESFIASRKHEGWIALPYEYNDHGYSGGTVERPAFQQLQRDVEAGSIDLVATYKIDRLSRSLVDFMQIMRLFEEHGVAFTSVTQQFDTSTSMGRLTLQLLASFAEFERAQIAERTRDKMVASRRRGAWTGGRPVLGYDVVEKKLIVNRDEAERVRGIFRLYLSLGSLLGVIAELNRRGWTNKTWTNQRGDVVTGTPFEKNTLRWLLTNPLYVGKNRCDGEIVDGVHEAIIDEETWNAVQAQLREHAGKRTWRRPVESGALLAGLIQCRCGAAMSRHRASKGPRQHESYVCTKYVKQGAAACPGSRVPTAKMDAEVIAHIRQIGQDPSLLSSTIDATKAAVLTRRPAMESELQGHEAERRRLNAERQNIVDAIAQGETGRSPLLERLGEIEGQLAEVGHRIDRARAELAALEAGVIDEDDLRLALADFDEIWGALFAAEKARVLQLLVERITFDGQSGDVAVKLRPCGIRTLAAERSRPRA
ncbi:MAG: recombinase family protein [Planctomycetes bacterium]|nr:recombinase family protein [Planctomycetota bacterium]MBI3844513.1 recombinase family protein [Planctomycetota bacterium]